MHLRCLLDIPSCLASGISTSMSLSFSASLCLSTAVACYISDLTSPSLAQTALGISWVEAWKWCSTRIQTISYLSLSLRIEINVPVHIWVPYYSTSSFSIWPQQLTGKRKSSSSVLDDVFHWSVVTACWWKYTYTVFQALLNIIFLAHLWWQAVRS